MKNRHFSLPLHEKIGISFLNSMFFFLILFNTHSLSAQNYCTARGTAPWEQWIERVSIANATGSTTFPTTSKDGYGNFTSATPANVLRGQTNLITISPNASWGADPNNANMFWRVWVDWNKDGDFDDADEQVVSRSVTIANGVFLDNETTFATPTTAALGATRLRVAMKVGGYPLPCETFTRGEVEDYTVQVMGSDVPIPVCSNMVSTTVNKVLCYNNQPNGTTTLYIAEDNTIFEKKLDKNGSVLNSSVAGNLLKDSILVSNNQIIKKLANGSIAYTKTIPPSVLSLVPSINAAVEMSDGTFGLAGFQKYFDPIGNLSLNKDSLVLVTTDANLVYQNRQIEARNSGAYNLFRDSVLQFILLPNNQFVVNYYFGYSQLINSQYLTFAKYQKNGSQLNRLNGTIYGDRLLEKPIFSTQWGNNLLVKSDISWYSIKSNFRGEGTAIFSLDSMRPIANRSVGTGSTDYYGTYNSYSYTYIPTSYQLVANYAGDPRIGLNDFSKLEIKFLNNSLTDVTHTKIIPFIAYEHIIRTGDTTCLVLGSTNGQTWAWNPDCNNPQPSLPDLTLSNLNMPTPSVQQGQILNFNVDIKNIGTAAATSNFTVKSYISTDNVLDANDIQDGVIPTANFAAGFSVPQVAGALRIPTTLPAGQYYLILKVDADNQITESNETNNVLVSTTTFIVTGLQTGRYCPSKGTAPWELWISKVQFGSINNASDKFKDFATLGYSDYTNLNTTILKGMTYQLTTTPGLSWIGYLPNVYCRTWIDWNGNNIFEDTELVFQNTNVNPFVSAVRVPTSAVVGTTRMRVSVKWGSFPTACETFDRGEVEDYTIVIKEPTDPCNNDTQPPVFTTCPRDTIVTIAQNQPYYEYSWINPTATDNCSTPSVSSNYGTPYIRLNDGQTAQIILTARDAAGNTANCSWSVTARRTTTGNPDIGLTIAATSLVYRQYQSNTFRISAQNNGNQSFTDVNIEFKFPPSTTNGGAATPSVGTWYEWCAGSVACYTWTIPSLAANTTATLDVPLFVLNATDALVATTKLLSSIPTDNNVLNNTATVIVNRASEPLASVQAKTTQQIPIVIQRIAPNPSDGEVYIELESLDMRTVQFDVSNTIGGTVFSEKRQVEKGINRIQFDVSALPQGIYFVAPATNRGKNVPTKFVKI